MFQNTNKTVRSI